MELILNRQMWYTSPPRRRLQLWIFILILQALGTVGSQFQRFANEPSPQTAVAGSTVVLPCRIINMAGVLQWTRDGFGLGNERQLYAFKRYQMIGSDEEGDYSLRISPVTLEDDAVFQCQATGNIDIPGIRSQEAKLTVYVPPAPPELTPGPVVKTTAGAAVQLTCRSRNGKPAAEIQWLDGDGRQVSEGVQYSTELLQDGHRQDAKSVLSFLASRNHHNKVFTCAASNPALHQPLTTQVTLEVRYPPEVTIIHDSDGYKEGETATLTCSATANPQKMTYRWYRSGQLVTGNNSTQLVVADLTRDVNLQDIICEASNEVGTSKKITRLSVHYGPSFRLPPQDEYGEMGENVTLKCQIDSLPDPTIVWINQQSQTVVGKGPRLPLQVTSNTVGTYMCLAKVNGFPEISGTVGVFLKGPPEVRAEKIQWGKQGDTVLVECLIASASARSANVKWTHHGKKVEIEPGRYEVVKDSTPHGLRHTLVIHNARMEDFGTYNCSVQNDFGSDIFEIILNKKKTLPLILILCVVCGGILFLLVVAVSVIWCAKRTTKKQKEAKSSGLPEKQVSLQMNDQNSTGNDSDLKVELDQRTGSSMSNKEADLEGWDKDLEHPNTPTYFSSNNSYLYPDAFTGIPLKINGHLNGNGVGHSYGNYADHATLVSTNANTPGYTTSPVLGGGLVSSSQHNLFPTYADYDASVYAPHHITPQETGLHHGFSPQQSNNGISNHSFKFSNAGSLPLSLHNNSNRISSSTTHTDTIPRLGIPVDPSQYIVPPRTQVMQGALATHV
ncbi:unnamed protein product [Meganyctiphanes norvegica]|uniref:Ig-like domain-containing protein n=1 Tax=Meganyctiphanes norvegica TaxID=48144 RepID=A0AAV2RWF7_MEGNR